MLVELTRTLLSTAQPFTGTASTSENTNAHDGVPGVTQCPIAPGKTTTYKFRAAQYGTSWYHSHFSLQLATGLLGLLGPLVIHGPATADYDVDLGPVVLMDWFHGSAFHMWETTQRVVALQQPHAENGLINRRNVWPACAAGSSSDPRCKHAGRRFEFGQPFEPGKKHLLRLIGSQTDGYFKFAIDGHKLTVVVEAKATAAQVNRDGLYWMRGIYQTACNFNDNDNKDNITGIIRYAGVGEAAPAPGAVPSTTKARSITNSCADEPYEGLVPWVRHDVGPADVSDRLRVGWYKELNLVYHWAINTRMLIVNWSDQTLLEVHRAGNTGSGQAPTLLALSNVVEVHTRGAWVYWVIEDRTLVNVWRPMHLHGHDFYVLAQGRGPFVPGLVRLSTKNPPRRDTVSLYGTGYTVIAFKTDNPGYVFLSLFLLVSSSVALSRR